MSDVPTNGIKVVYTVKELLTEISRDIKALTTKVDTKADQNVVNLLATQINVHESRLTTLEAQDKQKVRFENLWFPLIASLIVGVLVGAAGVFAALHH